MTNREKIDYLKQYKNLDRKIDRLLEEKERWKARAEKITPSISDMPHGGDGEDQRELAICKMIDCDKEATEEIDRLVDLGREIKKLIETVKDDDLQVLLTYRYIDGMTWEKVAVEMDFTFQWVHILHSRALNKIVVPIDCN